MTTAGENEPDVEVPVLVVGGSLVGLTTAMFLAQHGVDVLSVERHHGTAIRPRAGHFHLRTLELMRVAGIEDRVRSAALALYAPDGGINAVETLAGREIATYLPNINAGVEDISPARALFMPQQVLEPILLERAKELGARFLYATELVGHEQDDDGVTAIVRNVDGGTERSIKARYLVACDGNRSPIRNSLGIEVVGHGLLSRSVTIYFRADCSAALRGRNLGVIYVTNPQVRGFFRLERTGLGGFLVVFTVGDINEPGARFVADTITNDMAADLVRRAVGDPDLDVDVVAVDKWRAVAEAATTFQRGRVFLAGDAAHTMPPTGGFGGNSGVWDAHNLAWKLAYVLNGAAGTALLDTYDSERQPAGVLAMEQAYNRYVTRSDPDLGTEGMQLAVPDLHVVFNRYRSTAVIPDAGYVDDGELHIDPRASHGLPGTRAPHVVLAHGGTTISTLDLYEGKFVLMSGPDGQVWTEAAAAAATELGIDVLSHTVSTDDASAFCGAYGLSSSGAALVRPDGFVAWRAFEQTADAADRITSALRAVLSR
jgi:2-polyprenyl-6-methoxyphenol hydroxylase-like FAD-dependent oxidoreductase